MRNNRICSGVSSSIWYISIVVPFLILVIIMREIGFVQKYDLSI